MTLKIEMMRSFVTVAQTGNLIEAADRLGRTPSALSMTLKQFEEHLGKRLFLGERKNRLTPLGTQVFDLALKQVRQFDEAVQSMETLARAGQGLLRIVSVPSVAAMLFPSILAHMTEQFPGLKLDLRDTDTEQVLDSLAEGKADIGVASGHHALKETRASLLFEDRFGLVCSADHPLWRQKENPSLEDVFAHDFLRNTLCDLIETKDFASTLRQTDITIHNTHSLLAMVRSGNWVTVLPRTVASYMPDATRFRPIRDLKDHRQVFIYQREQPRFPEITKACTDFIQGQHFG
ncbi:LysR family transcriptional regulator [uncultured Shimia sp.]|uniref:LysR family transcriptional regulator n=1 Tax=uncultured Shimia sp. TaxID=573152 RepID=UPI0026182ACB|nr:LysR family transcriptional regulator [uncultured Shimia sp.]